MTEAEMTARIHALPLGGSARGMVAGRMWIVRREPNRYLVFLRRSGFVPHHIATCDTAGDAVIRIFEAVR